MNHFNLKSLAFYAVAIGSVVLLFNAVTAYGERRLKASPPVGDRYRIDAQNLPGCLKADTLVLNIQQSGVYLSGSLLPAKTDAQTQTIAQEKPSLSGQIKYPQFNLVGTVPFVEGCDDAAGDAGAGAIEIQATVQDKSLAGEITLGSAAAAAEFSAQQEEATAASEPSH